MMNVMATVTAVRSRGSSSSKRSTSQRRGRSHQKGREASGFLYANYESPIRSPRVVSRKEGGARHIYIARVGLRRRKKKTRNRLRQAFRAWRRVARSLLTFGNLFMCAYERVRIGLARRPKRRAQGQRFVTPPFWSLHPKKAHTHSHGKISDPQAQSCQNYGNIKKILARVLLFALTYLLLLNILNTFGLHWPASDEIRSSAK
jgi:hypothetical protein